MGGCKVKKWLLLCCLSESPPDAAPSVDLSSPISGIVQLRVEVIVPTTLNQGPQIILSMPQYYLEIIGLSVIDIKRVVELDAWVWVWNCTLDQSTSYFTIHHHISHNHQTVHNTSCTSRVLS